MISMPKVSVKYFANLRELIDVKEKKYKVEDGTTLRARNGEIIKANIVIGIN